MEKILKTTLCCLLVMILSACAPVTAQRGNLLADYQISEIKAGQHSRSDVLRNFGSPTTQSTFDNDVWYYIGQETEKHGILDEEVTNERIVVVSFTDDGIVKSVEERDADRVSVPYSRRKTPTHGNDLTFMQQLLGNVGRFNSPQQAATDQY